MPAVRDSHLLTLDRQLSRDNLAKKKADDETFWQSQKGFLTIEETSEVLSLSSPDTISHLSSLTVLSL
jgi:hypothetical protein